MSSAGLRILVLTNLYPPTSTGGYECACHRVVKGLRARGHDLWVLTSAPGVTSQRGDEHVRYDLRYWRTPPYKVLGIVRQLRSESHNQAALERALKQIEPNVVFVWGMWGLGMSLLYTVQRWQIPTVYYIHDNWLADGYRNDPWLSYWQHQPSNALKRRLKRLFYLYVLRRLVTPFVPVEYRTLDLHHVAFISKFRKQECMARGWPVEQAQVIYNGVDLTSFRPAEHSSGRPPELRILFAGRLVPQKGLHTLLEALATLVPVLAVRITLTVAGDGGASAPELRIYQQQVQQLADLLPLAERVRFRGAVPPEEMPDVYREHDVLVFPSLEAEGFPLVLLEAMACALTVVSTTVGGAAELLADGENCLTFRPGDTQGLVSCLQRLVADPTLRQTLADRGRQTVIARFGLNTQLDAVEGLLRQSFQQESILEGPSAVSGATSNQ